MDQFFEFVANHWILSGAFVALLVAFFVNEMKRTGQSVTSQELVNLVNREKAVVVDVRDATEYSSGHITDAINIPHTALQTRLNELEKFKERPVVVVCKMGQHAGSMGTILKKAGFKHVAKLKGGLSSWRAENMPLVKGRN